MAEQEPLFRVVRGTPTAAEVAALVGVLVARSRPVAAATPAAPSAWRRSALPRTAVTAGRDGWRRSGLPS
ncbi:acyl-CoA carboxylase subunit epsilon [Plantactinospora sp. GCM10030261]|uniref:acyl-CoA carboxylase subunit epsilon n=1 Tax=Plantactinospora sp. GCM10030261 TaxID=3273420 RepID=UPI0036159A99